MDIARLTRRARFRLQTSADVGVYTSRGPCRSKVRRAAVPSLRRIAIGAVIGACLAVPVLPADALGRPPGWKMTHKVTIEGEFVNHWTINDPDECDPVGSGTVTFRFRTTVATRVKPYKDTYRGGGWNVAIPYGYKGHLLRGMKYVKASGTITRVDNTIPRPSSDPSSPCRALSKTGCGTFPLKSSVLVDGQHNPRRITVQTTSNLAFDGGCLSGDASSFDATRALVGGNSEGKVTVRMPRPSAFKRRRVVLSGQTHQKSSWGDAGQEKTTNDITRKVTVRFKHL
jgi:hypothetical protein